MDLTTAVPGVDLSHYDDAKGARLLEYGQLAASVRWAVLRVGDGSANDVSFDRHVTGLAGKVPLGTYFFCRPGRDPGQQAHAWASTVQRAEGWGAKFALGHWADLEANDGRNRAEVTQWVDRFLFAADGELGRPVGVYTGAPWWSTNVNFIPRFRRWWIARYPWDRTPPPADPADWPAWVAARANERAVPHAPGDEPASIWQFSSAGLGTAIGTYRDALDCDVMSAELFASVTAAVVTESPHTPGTPNQEEDMRIIHAPDGRIAVVGEKGKRHLEMPEWSQVWASRIDAEVDDATWDSIPDA